MRTRFLILLCACLFAIVSIQCGKGKEGRTYSRDSTVIVAVSDISAMLPDKTDADFLVFLPLATWGENGELEGRLAESWEHSPNYREWIYHLRKDIQWHDGVPVTAHDLKFTIDLLTHPDVLVYPHLSATVLNDSTLKIESSHVHGYQDDIVYYPKHLLENLDPKEFWDWEFWKRPVGNGPYRFVRYMPQTMIEFEANPDYYRGKPSIERVILKFVGETGGLTELLSGNVNAWPYANPAHIPQLAADPRFRVYQTGPDYAGGLAIYWQHNNPLFRDARVRRALTLAINREELLKMLNLPESLLLFDGPITVRQYHRRQLPEPVTYNPAQARTLLDAAGWHDPDGDGVREREGQAFRFTAIAFTDPVVNSDKSAVYIQAQLRQVGVQMDIQMLDLAVVWEGLSIGKFDAAFMVVQSAPQWYQKYFGVDSPLGYNNPEVIKLIDQAVATADPNEEDRIYHELMRIFREEQPITYIMPLTWTSVAHRRVQGLSTPFRADPLKIMGDLWLRDEAIEQSMEDAQELSHSAERGPTILLDTAHHNFIDIVESHGGWLEEEGFRVLILSKPFDHESLVDVNVVISAVPVAARNAVTRPFTEEKFAMAWKPPFPSAFSADEISALHEWVWEGGGLILVFDHMPVSNAIEELAASFGVKVANGHAYDERMLRWEDNQLSRKEAGSAVFRRSNGTLAVHAITAGRSVSERIDLVALGGGAAFRLPPEGRPLLTLGAAFVSLLPEAPFRFREDTPRQPIGGWSQGGVLRVGRGRFAIFSDLGFLATHEEVAVQEPPWNVWQLQNPQLLLNVLHWLLGLLDERQ